MLRNEVPRATMDLEERALEADRRGRYSEALACFSKAIEAAPTVLEYRLWRGRLLAMTGRAKEALPDVAAAERLAPGDRNVIALAAIVSAYLQDEAQFKAACDNAVKSLGKPLSPLLLGSLYEVLGRDRDAEAALLGAMDTSRRGGALEWLGDFYLRRGKFEAAAEQFAGIAIGAPIYVTRPEAGGITGPVSGTAWCALALLAAGRPSDAEARLEQVMKETDPSLGRGPAFDAAARNWRLLGAALIYVMSRNGLCPPAKGDNMARILTADRLLPRVRPDELRLSAYPELIAAVIARRVSYQAAQAWLTGVQREAPDSPAALVGQVLLDSLPEFRVDGQAATSQPATQPGAAEQFQQRLRAALMQIEIKI